MYTAHNIIQKNFPELNKKRSSLEAELLIPKLILSSAHQRWFVQKDAKKIVQDLEHGLNLFIEAYNSLPRDLPKKAGFPERDKLWDLAYTILGSKPNIGDAFPNLVERKEYPDQLGALTKLKEIINLELRDLHTNQASHDIPQKAALYEYCVEVWERIKERPAPVKPSEATAFADFLVDVISLCEKSWSIESVYKAYGRL